MKEKRASSTPPPSSLGGVRGARGEGELLHCVHASSAEDLPLLIFPPPPKKSHHRRLRTEPGGGSLTDLRGGGASKPTAGPMAGAKEGRGRSKSATERSRPPPPLSQNQQSQQQRPPGSGNTPTSHLPPPPPPVFHTYYAPYPPYPYLSPYPVPPYFPHFLPPAAAAAAAPDWAGGEYLPQPPPPPPPPPPLPASQQQQQPPRTQTEALATQQQQQQQRVEQQPSLLPYHLPQGYYYPPHGYVDLLRPPRRQSLKARLLNPQDGASATLAAGPGGGVCGITVASHHMRPIQAQVGGGGGEGERRREEEEEEEEGFMTSPGPTGNQVLDVESLDVLLCELLNSCEQRVQSIRAECGENNTVPNT